MKCLKKKKKKENLIVYKNDKRNMCRQITRFFVDVKLQRVNFEVGKRNCNALYPRLQLCLENIGLQMPECITRNFT